MEKSFSLYKESGDWDFRDADTKEYTHSFHIYPAMMIPQIARRLIDIIEPKWLRLGGYWYPRGRIPIDIFFQTGDIPKGIWVPDPAVPNYRGRG